MIKMKFFLLLLFVIFVTKSSQLHIKKSSYKNIVIEVEETVPIEQCFTILSDIETAFKSASQFLFSALDGRLFFGSVTVIIPKSWTQNCIPFNGTIVPSSGEKKDITVLNEHPIHKDRVWTMQYGGCEEQGGQIYLPLKSLKRKTVGKELIREWAKYRYGVFDEIGYQGDQNYPKCYVTDRKHVTGCSDSPLFDKGNCKENDINSPDLKEIMDKNTRSSIMFAAEVDSVVLFCDDGKHNRIAPNKQNQMCNRRSTLDVILKHNDFVTKNYDDSERPLIVDTQPIFTYKKRLLTRYILIIDTTQDMLVRESWNFLRSAIRKWIVYDLQGNTEIGLIMANNTSDRIQTLMLLNDFNDRDKIASLFPYNPSDSRKFACLSCAITDGITMLSDRTQLMGPASNVILVIAPGMDYNTDFRTLTTKAKAKNIRIATINYPIVVKRQPLDVLALLTDGQSYTIYEQKYNSENSYLTTYFELSNVLLDISNVFYEGNIANLPIEIHRKELVDFTDEVSITKLKESREVTSSFVLDKEMGTPANFFVFIHNNNHPLIHGLKLISPSQITYTGSDARLLLKQLTIPAVINETGSWTYIIKRFIGNPQSHFVQVMATPRSYSSNVLRARAWIKRAKNNIGPIRIFVELKLGEYPVQSGSVEVIISRPDVQCNSTNECNMKLNLFDNGSGDPDLIKGDGIYSRYFTASKDGPGLYKFDIVVTDNGNTAYTLSEKDKSLPENCCGSIVPTPSKQTTSTFLRVLTPITIFFTQEQLTREQEMKEMPYGHIGDLSLEIMLPGKARIKWTTPDMGGNTVERYEVKYSTNIYDIIDNYETAAILWHHNTPSIYATGFDSSFNINYIHDLSIMGKSIYIAVRPYTKLTNNTIPGQISNYLRIRIPNIQTSTVSSPTYNFHDNNKFNGIDSNIDNINSYFDGIEDSGDSVTTPRISTINDFTDNLIVPIISVILVVLVLAIFCCVFTTKRKHCNQNVRHENSKKSLEVKQEEQQQQEHDLEQQSQHSDTNDTHINNIPSPTHYIHNVSQISSPIHEIQHQPQNLVNGDRPDPHTVGLPIYNDDDNDNTSILKKGYSIVRHPYNQQLIDELTQQQINNCGLSIISNNNNNTTLPRNVRTLSPFESWTASELLHEHEKRHSPMNDITDMPDQISLINEQQHQQQQQQQQQQHNQYQQPQQRMIVPNCNRPLQLQYLSPTVPPLPYLTSNFSPQQQPTAHELQQQNQPHHIISNYHNNRNFGQIPGVSLCSVNCGDKKKRNVTMV